MFQGKAMIFLKPHTHTHTHTHNLRGRNSKQSNTVNLDLGLRVRSVPPLDVDRLNIPAKGQCHAGFLKIPTLCYL